MSIYGEFYKIFSKVEKQEYWGENALEQTEGEEKIKSFKLYHFDVCPEHPLMNEERSVGFLAVFLGIGCHKGMHGVTGWLSLQKVA